MAEKLEMWRNWVGWESAESAGGSPGVYVGTAGGYDQTQNHTPGDLFSPLNPQPHTLKPQDPVHAKPRTPLTLDDAVELGALVPEALLAGGQRTEVLRRLGHALAVQPHLDASSGLAPDGNVEEHRVRDLGALLSLGVGDARGEEAHRHGGDARELGVAGERHRAWYDAV